MTPSMNFSIECFHSNYCAAPGVPAMASMLQFYHKCQTPVLDGRYPECFQNVSLLRHIRFKRSADQTGRDVCHAAVL